MVGPVVVQLIKKVSRSLVEDTTECGDPGHQAKVRASGGATPWTSENELLLTVSVSPWMGLISTSHNRFMDVNVPGKDHKR